MTVKEDILRTKEDPCKACKIRKCLLKIATRFCVKLDHTLIKEACDLLGVVPGEWQDI